MRIFVFVMLMSLKQRDKFCSDFTNITAMRLLILTVMVFTFFGFAMAQENIADCRIIRIVEIPLTKKQNIPKEPKIALLNTCLKDEIPQQRPVIEVVRNGKKEFREFEVIKVFADKTEAEKYAEENHLTDVVLSFENELEKIDAELTAAFSEAMRGDYTEELIKLQNEFKHLLKEKLKNPLTFKNNLGKLSNEIFIVTSPDKSLKFYSWDNRTGGTWHNMTAIAQYKDSKGKIRVSELNDPNLDELPKQTDFIIKEIYQISINNKTHYLTFGWGTHGGGHQFDVVQIFKIEDFGLIEDNSALPEKRELIILYPRSEKSDLFFDSGKNEISYKEFVEDKDTGFMKPTGKNVTLRLTKQRFVKRNRVE